MINELSSEDILAVLNRLFEKRHQADGSNSSIQFVYVAPGAQHVERIDSQTIYVSPTSDNRPQQRGHEDDGGALAPELDSDEARRLWAIAQENGWVDERHQPLVSRTQAALLAYEMAELLGIKEKWKTFESFWNRRNMYRDYYEALNQQQSLTFREEIRQHFG